MEDEAITNFMAITSATAQQAQSYLQITDGNLEQAIQLFFDSPGLDVGSTQSSSTTQPQPPPVPPRPSATYTEDDDGVIRIDSDDDDDANIPRAAPAASTFQPAAHFEDDEALARRLQEEMYAGGDMAGGLDADGVRAPIARTQETLVGPDVDFDGEGIQASIARQMFERERRRQAGRPGIFNQRDSQPTIWEDNDPVSSQRELARATGGASDASSKSNHLANLFRPPFELMTSLTWEDARDEGKEEEKWLLVNIQEPSVFDCQVLNRDIWKDKRIMEAVKENFIFMQYNAADPRAAQYLQYYFHAHESQDAYPHIAIVDPRTGEQVKVWSGPPAPKADDFLQELHEFLDRYSLNVNARNPVATRKPERPRAMEVERMTEDEMLQMALRNSLAANGGDSPASRAFDPDALTKDGDTGTDKGKGRAATPAAADLNGLAREPSASPPPATPFDGIRSDAPHEQPAEGTPGTTGIMFRSRGGRAIHRFRLDDPVRRIFEWLKADPDVLGGRDAEGRPREFDLVSLGRNLMGEDGAGLELTVDAAGLANSSVMVQYLD